MTFVLNKRYGGFSVSDFVVEQLGLESRYDFDCGYTNEQDINKLAELINTYGSEKCSGPSAKLKVVEIPDNASDWEINDYDGVETITYVVDGKLHHA